MVGKQNINFKVFFRPRLYVHYAVSVGPRPEFSCSQPLISPLLTGQECEKLLQREALSARCGCSKYLSPQVDILEQMKPLTGIPHLPQSKGAVRIKRLDQINSVLLSNSFICRHRVSKTSEAVFKGAIVQLYKTTKY